MRGADAGTPAMMVAQSALWVGLLYDEATLEAALALLRGVSWEEVVALRQAVPRLGLAAPFRGRRLGGLARDVLALADDGLRARARPGLGRRDERPYLDPLHAIAAGAPGQAEHWLARYRTVWKGDVRPIFAEAAI